MIKNKVQIILEDLEGEATAILEALQALKGDEYHLEHPRVGQHQRLIMGYFDAPNQTTISFYFNRRGEGNALHLDIRGITDDLDGADIFAIVDKIHRTISPETPMDKVPAIFAEMLDELYDRLMLELHHHLEQHRRRVDDVQGEYKKENPDYYKSRMLVTLRPFHRAIQKLKSIKINPN